MGRNNQSHGPNLKKRPSSPEPLKEVSRQAITHLSFFYVLLHAATFAAPVFALVLYSVPRPYLDEIFHIPLSEYYCSTLDFTKWDPMITTPPGLYWLATAYARFIVAPLLAIIKAPVNALLQLKGVPTLIRFGLGGISDASECGVGSLRSVNFFALILVFPCSLWLFFKAQTMLEAGPKPPKKLKFNTKQAGSVAGKKLSGKDANGSQDTQKNITNEKTGENFSEASRMVLSLFQFPLMFFFSMLFYTDVWSTTLVILSLAVGKYAIALSDSEQQNWVAPSRKAEKLVVVSALLALISLTFRQTNVIWAAYIGASLLEDLTNLRLNQKKLNAQKQGTVSDDDAKNVDNQCCSCSGLISLIKSSFLFILSYVKTIFSFDSVSISIILSYGAVGGAFVAFYIWNEGITLGDKSHHQVSANIGQLVYFLLHITIFMGPPAFVWAGFQVFAQVLCSLFETKIDKPGFEEDDDDADLVQDSQPNSFKNPNDSNYSPLFKLLVAVALLFAIACPVFAIFLNKWAFPAPLHPHPFLLADNRHYTFYIWRRLINPARNNLKVALLVSPLFVAGLFILVGLGPLTQFFQRLAVSARNKNKTSTNNKSIKKNVVNRHFISTAVFYLGVLATLVPSPLLEPRYYMVPFVLWRITIATDYQAPSDTASEPVPASLLLDNSNNSNSSSQKDSITVSGSDENDDGNVSEGPKEPRNAQSDIQEMILKFVTWPLQDFELIWWTVINMLTIYVFIKFPFEWINEPNAVQRFMW